MASIKPIEAKPGDTVTVGDVDTIVSGDKKQLTYAEAVVQQVVYERAPVLERKARLLQELVSIAKHQAKTEIDLAAVNAVIAKMDELKVV